jgi:hypothetical protein
MNIGDIVAINRHPAKRTWSSWVYAMPCRRRWRSPERRHADLSPALANPARAGEILTVGATRASTFSDSAVQEVNSPVTVVFDGTELPVISNIGWTGQKTLDRVLGSRPCGNPSGRRPMIECAAIAGRSEERRTC